MVHLLLAIIYLSFISLGLPDSLLGSAWPSMYEPFGVPISFAGIISMIIALGTVISSLQSDRLTRKFGTAAITAASVALTAIAIFGFSFSSSFWMLCLWAIPYGLGAGSIDASLNNYVALHYASKHMSWLHCMWGVGTIIGPYVMGYALSHGVGWNAGYRWIGFIQAVLTVLLIISLPVWKKQGSPGDSSANEGSPDNASAKETSSKEASAKEMAAKTTAPLTLKQIFHIRGAKEVMLAFFCYCAIEQTANLWASSYMVLHNGISAELAANYASLFFIGITVGRGINGFLTIKFSDTQMIRTGQILIALGCASMLLPLGNSFTMIGLILIGLGCAPIYPCIIHSTPIHFGADRSQALIGVQMASAYAGTCLMPPVFGFIANSISVALLPVFLLLLLGLMIRMHEKLVKITN